MAAQRTELVSRGVGYVAKLCHSQRNDWRLKDTQPVADRFSTNALPIQTKRDMRHIGDLADLTAHLAEQRTPSTQATFRIADGNERRAGKTIWPRQRQRARQAVLIAQQRQLPSQLRCRKIIVSVAVQLMKAAHEHGQVRLTLRTRMQQIR